MARTITTRVNLNQEVEIKINLEDISTADLAQELKSRECLVVVHEYMDQKLKWEVVKAHINDFSWEELSKMFQA